MKYLNSLPRLNGHGLGWLVPPISLTRSSAALLLRCVRMPRVGREFSPGPNCLRWANKQTNERAMMKTMKAGDDIYTTYVRVPISGASNARSFSTPSELFFFFFFGYYGGVRGYRETLISQNIHVLHTYVHA